ncbi:hypothetical protein LP417_03655 [Polaromonas sp. P1-6]|nr:hypothetical protein LP417_03655 [Polaromonas sp. P1-6]
MKQKIFQCIAVLLVFVAHVSTSLAEDIELFVGAPPTTAETPNVLIVLDNTANWNTAFVNEKPRSCRSSKGCRLTSSGSA